MDPIFKIGDEDFTEYLKEDGLKPSWNDLDADGSGRNLLDGLMYRSRIATKYQVTVSFLPLDENTQQRLRVALDPEYIQVTTLDSKTMRHVQRSCYCSKINEGVQRKLRGRVVYDGVTFTVTER